jgi:hypothetical protein
MKNAAIMICALAVLFGAPAAAEAQTAPKLDASARACLARAKHDDSDLSLQTRQTRERLIRDPSQISAVIEAAGAANVVARAQIELGVARAVEYLKCVDQAGYQALTDYLKTHSDNPVVTDVDQTVNALEVAGAPTGPPGEEGGTGGGGGGFSSGGGPPSSPQ